MKTEESASRDSWKHLRPLPSAHQPLNFRRKFGGEEYRRISRGLIPLEMEDKWFIFLEGDYLYFHRSWTGALIYQIRFGKNGDMYVVEETLVNRDPSEYKATDDDHDVAMLSFLLDNFLLGRKTPFPMPADLPKELPKGLYQHHISGSGYPEVDAAEWKEES